MMQVIVHKVSNMGFVLVGPSLMYLEATFQSPEVPSQRGPCSPPSQQSFSAIPAGSADQDGSPLNSESPQLFQEWGQDLPGHGPACPGFMLFSAEQEAFLSHPKCCTASSRHSWPGTGLPAPCFSGWLSLANTVG